MPRKRLNGKNIYFSNLRIEFFFFFLISNPFLAFVWLPRKWRKKIYDSTIEAWSHTHLHVQHTICKIHKFQNENSTAPNKPQSKPTSHQYILQIQNQPRNPFVERNSIKYKPSWLVIPVISAKRPQSKPDGSNKVEPALQMFSPVFFLINDFFHLNAFLFI